MPRPSGPAAPDLWGRLAPLSFDEQLRAAAVDETFHTWGLCRLLQVKSGGEAREDPAAAGRLAQLALVIVREAAAFAEHQLLSFSADARAGDAGARLAGEAWWQLQLAQDAEVEVSMRRVAAAADPCNTPPLDTSDVS